MKNLNFTIVKDDQIQSGLGMTSLSDKSDSAHQVSYDPGNLSVAQSDYDKLMSDSTVTTITLNFYFDDFDKRKESHEYEIELNKYYPSESYAILEIFNLDNKKYREAFKTYVEKYAKGKQYVHQIKCSSVAALIVRDKWN